MGTDYEDLSCRFCKSDLSKVYEKVPNRMERYRIPIVLNKDTILYLDFDIHELICRFCLAKLCYYPNMDLNQIYLAVIYKDGQLRVLVDDHV